MPTSISISDTTARPSLGGVDWETFGWLVNIPQHNRERFALWLVARIEREWKSDAEAISEQTASPASADAGAAADED